MAVWLRPLTFMLNQAIQQDSFTADKLSDFEQRVIALNLSDLDKTFLIRFSDKQVDLSEGDDEADLTITGTISALIKLSQDPSHLFSPDIRIHGDVSFAKQLQDVLESFEFDWEAQIAKVTGNTLAQPLVYSIREGLSWLKNTHSSVQMSLSEYLREEIQLLPHHIEVEDYLNDIDTLRADYDRLDARIQRLIQQRNAKV